MRLVLDTNVVASALLWGGQPRLLLQAKREKRVELFTSIALLTELTGILSPSLIFAPAMSFKFICAPRNF